ncbi:MAG: cation-translocating P-type ATPase [Clostridiales bacterium]|nr:cation-translocating P-type ATPase [Clostridiales bacterium]
MKDPFAGPMGLTTREAERLLALYGPNELAPQTRAGPLARLLRILAEPMFLLLLAAALLYFVLGQPNDGRIMLVFVAFVIGIEAVQALKTDRTLQALRDLSAPRARVVRDGREAVIPASALVPGDLLQIQEGVKIPADGLILRQSDLCVDESALTGEAEGVWKAAAGEAAPSAEHWRRDRCYAGTLVLHGSATVQVEQTGAKTEYGRIGAAVAQAPEAPTPLQRQLRALVNTCVRIAAALFVLVGVATWFNLPAQDLADRLTQSVLAGITLAMAMIPEEFPVILTVFLSMGAWRLARKNALVRRLPSVETLGAVSVLCVDKTGTLTENQMAVLEVWPAQGDPQGLVRLMGLACEPEAYDPMEQALLRHCATQGFTPAQLFEGELLGEYAFTHARKMMGHLWRRGEALLIAAKGAPERLLPLCDLDDAARAEAERRVLQMSRRGLRVLAVAGAHLADPADAPAELEDGRYVLGGLVGLADPLRPSVRRDLEVCAAAGIRTVMITGDSGVTAAAVARSIGLPGDGEALTGDHLEELDDAELRAQVARVNLFCRVLPAHKMRIVKALQDNGELVAMTGDGVNDAAALKYADIGIAMGGRGSDVAREAADLILLDDCFSTIIETVRDGRRIFDNLRKAFGYVLAIHIPIAAASLLGPLLGTAPDQLFLLPLHVMLLELVIDPTCSIVLERQPPEPDLMRRGPRPPGQPLFDRALIGKSLLQGAAIFAASFGAYRAVLAGGPGRAPTARAMGLAVLLLANLFLVQVNSSDRAPLTASLRATARDPVMWAANLLTLLGLALMLSPPLSGALKLAPLSAGQALAALALAAASTLWYEAVKCLLRPRERPDAPPGAPTPS